MSPLDRYAKGGSVTLPPRLYRGIRHPVFTPGPLEQLAGARMAEPASNKMINTTKGATWWTSNPRVSSAYTWNNAGARSLVVPADLVVPPDLVLKADGAPWSRYFSDNKVFRQAMRDPAIRAIMVKDVVDPGSQWFDQLPELVRRTKGKKNLDEILDEYFMADNVLVKDHSVLRYLSGESVEYARGGRV